MMLHEVFKQNLSMHPNCVPSTNITKLEIELLLPTGIRINMNSIDYSLTLEIGQLEGGNSIGYIPGSNNSCNKKLSIDIHKN